MQGGCGHNECGGEGTYGCTGADAEIECKKDIDKERKVWLEDLVIIRGNDEIFILFKIFIISFILLFTSKHLLIGIISLEPLLYKPNFLLLPWRIILLR